MVWGSDVAAGVSAGPIFDGRVGEAAGCSGADIDDWERVEAGVLGAGVVLTVWLLLGALECWLLLERRRGSSADGVCDVV